MQTGKWGTYLREGERKKEKGTHQSKVVVRPIEGIADTVAVRREIEAVIRALTGLCNVSS